MQVSPGWEAAPYSVQVAREDVQVAQHGVQGAHHDVQVTHHGVPVDRPYVKVACRVYELLSLMNK